MFCGTQPTDAASVGCHDAGTRLAFDAAYREELAKVSELTNQGEALATFGSELSSEDARGCAEVMGGKATEAREVFALVAIRSTPLAATRRSALDCIPAERARRTRTREVASPTPSAVSAERPGRRRTACHA